MSGIDWIIFGLMAIGAIAITVFLHQAFENVQDRLALDLLNDWASKNNHVILSHELRRYFRGPFGFSPFKFGSTVFFCRMKDGEGNERNCWISLGGAFGIFSNAVKIKWE